jgi:hypothetical protein
MLHTTSRIVAWLLLSAIALPAQVSRFEGHWRHDVGASQPGYLSGEYPGMEVRIVVDGSDLVVTQSVGETQDGVPLPDSGERSVEYRLVADGAAHRLPLGETGWRQVTAQWQGETLRLAFPFGPSARFVESWTIAQDGSSLVIERTRTRDGAERVQRIVFRRVPA